MKKSNITLVFVLILCLIIITACSKNVGQDVEGLKLDTINGQSQLDIPSYMGIYNAIDFNFNSDNKGVVTIYTNAEKDDEGDFMWDDSNKFMVVVEIKDKSYILMEEELVSLGMPHVDVFEDAYGKLHIILNDKRTAVYKVYDHEYNVKNSTFDRFSLLNFEGINYFGGI